MRRNEFEICLSIMEAVKSKKLIVSAIDRKTRVNVKDLNRYLDFLESAGYASSESNENMTRGNGKSRLYTLEKSGGDFLREWEYFKRKYNIDNLEKHL